MKMCEWWRAPGFARQYDELERSIANVADGDLKAPNGQPTRLTRELWIATRTDVFKRWFNGSVAVNDNGEPLVLWHGSPALFDRFAANANERFGRYEDYGELLWFSDCERVAKTYRATESGPVGPLYGVFLNVQNPQVIEGGGANVREVFAAEMVLPESDGVILRGVVDFANPADGVNRQICEKRGTEEELGWDGYRRCMSDEEYAEAPLEVKARYEEQIAPVIKYRWRGRFYYPGDDAAFPPGLRRALEGPGAEQVVVRCDWPRMWVAKEMPEICAPHTSFAVKNPGQVAIVSINGRSTIRPVAAERGEMDDAVLDEQCGAVEGPQRKSKSEAEGRGDAPAQCLGRCL